MQIGQVLTTASDSTVKILQHGILFAMYHSAVIFLALCIKKKILHSINMVLKTSLLGQVIFFFFFFFLAHCQVLVM